MGPVENATRVMDKASVSIHKSTRKKNCRAALLLRLCAPAEQSTDC